jgi:hypothetical protein
MNISYFCKIIFSKTAMRQKLTILASIFSLTLASSSAIAQWMKSNGPYGGTHVISLSVSGMNISAWTSDSGVFRSTDNGTTWMAENTGLFSAGCDFAMSGANIFAVTSDSVFHSTDNGATWSATSTQLPTGSILPYSFAESGTNLFVGTVDNGVYRSNDYGASWTSCPYTLGCPCDGSIAASGTNIFVWTGISSVIFSPDNGVSFTLPFNNGLPEDADANVLLLAAIGTNVFAATSADGVLRSTDNANNWTGVPGLPNFTSFAATGAELFAGTDNGVFLSTDNGASWTPVCIGLPNTNITSLVVSGTNLFAATDSNGLWQRPLSDFGTAAVSPVATIQNSIQSYPNPFSQSTEITFTSDAAGYADISIVNLLGEQVARIFSGELDAGEHNFTFSNTTNLPDGTYECLVRMNGSVETLPIALVH